MAANDVALREMIEIIIIEDKKPIRDGLAVLINGTEGFHCAGSYGSAEEALAGLVAIPPHVALVDIGLPGMSGIQAVGKLRSRYPSLLCLMLTVYEDNDRIFDALCAGAAGYLLKKTPPAKLLEAIQDTVAGGSPMSPEIARRVITLFREIRPPSRSDYNLTPHEMRILKLIVEGHNYTTAAVELGVSINTVSFHMRHIYEKLQVHSKSEAVAKALRDRIFK